MDRRAAAQALTALAAGPTLGWAQPADIDLPGAFEVVPGRPGTVIGVPHGTADTGTLEAGRLLCERLGAAGVFATGFWDPTSRQRVNVNRPTEQLIGRESQVLRQWRSERAAAANARYEQLVQQAAQGRLKAFYELHSNNLPPYADSIEVSTRGVERGEAQRFKAAFEAARERLAANVPRLAVHVSPLDQVSYPNYGNASTISLLADKGCAIEHPRRIAVNRAWRHAYAECLAEAIREAPWA